MIYGYDVKNDFFDRATCLMCPYKDLNKQGRKAKRRDYKINKGLNNE